MNDILLVVYIWLAFVAMSFWESSVEGRKAWDKGKIGWKIKIGKYTVATRYHFWIWVMLIMLFSLPFLIFGWNRRIFGIFLSGFSLGFVIEDFFWYILNPRVKIREFYTGFSDYYPWIKFGGRKIIPWGYFFGIVIAIISWIIFVK